jgi:choline-glycine betaine transporter
MSDATLVSHVKEGITMDKLLKVHMTIVIAILVFVLGTLGFFMVRFVNTVDAVDAKVQQISEEVRAISNDTEWIKSSVIELKKGIKD